ncbi:MAG: AraC family transcriptional regulator [Rhizobiaceae bacterium]|nr:AraC family transcriptional regulator [Rhizobiaceae bacterium]
MMENDALSQILNALQMRGTVYFHTDFSSPWGVEVPQYSNVARFHMVMRGSCVVTIDGRADPIHLSTGDLVVIPHGVCHILSDAPDRQADELDFVLSKSGYNGSGALIYGGPEQLGSCKLFCGHFEFEEGATHPLLAGLPEVIHLPNTQTMNAEWLDSVIRFVSSEVLGEKAGAEAIVHRLTEIIFIQTVRAFVDSVGDQAGSLAGVLDPKLSRSLNAVHSKPEEKWTVESMAAMAGMSRTVFAERFSRLIGMTPHNYVTHWRMQLAYKMLAGGSLSIIDIAETVGYGSEAAFTRAFKNQFDITPALFRKQAKIEKLLH